MWCIVTCPQRNDVHVIYIYIPRTQMTLILIEKRPCFGGFNPQNRGQTGSRYTYHHIVKLYQDLPHYSLGLMNILEVDAVTLPHQLGGWDFLHPQ